LNEDKKYTYHCSRCRNGSGKLFESMLDIVCLFFSSDCK